MTPIVNPGKDLLSMEEVRARCVASGIPDTGTKEAMLFRLASARRSGLHVEVRVPNFAFSLTFLCCVVFLPSVLPSLQCFLHSLLVVLCVFVAFVAHCSLVCRLRSSLKNFFARFLLSPRLRLLQSFLSPAASL